MRRVRFRYGASVRSRVRSSVRSLARVPRFLSRDVHVRRSRFLYFEWLFMGYFHTGNCAM